MRANQVTRPILGLVGALGFMALAAPVFSTSAAAFECQSGGGSPGSGTGSENDGGHYSNTACGSDAVATGGNNASAFGDYATASGYHTTAVGAWAVADHLDSTAVGYYASATASGATAIGGGDGAGVAASASGEFSIAIGGGSTNGASATATDAIAVGENTVAGYANSAAFGAGAKTQYANQQVFGTVSNTYTMPGITSSASTIAQSGQLGLVTTDGNGNLASDPGLYNQIGKNTEGVAMAMALGGFWVPENKNMAFGLNVGSFDGAWAIGGNLGGKVSDNLHLTAGIAVSQSGQVGGRAGGVISW